MTLSLLAYCSENQEVGGIVFSYYIGVAGVTLRARPAGGVLVTQCYSEPEILHKLADRLTKGDSSQKVINSISKRAQQPDRIQAACIDRKGRIAVKKSVACAENEETIIGDNFVVLANTASLGAPEVMATTFADAWKKRDTSLSLALTTAALAADAHGGDTRGRLAAGLRITSTRNERHYGIDLRSDYSQSPLRDIKRQIDYMKRL